MPIVYNLLTGGISRVIGCPLGYESTQCKEGEWWKPESADQLAYYIDIGDLNHPILPRVEVPYGIDKTTIMADGIDYLTINNLPVTPVFITVQWSDGKRDLLTGDFIEFGHDVPGSYDIILESPIHLPTTITVTAT